jgi:hypothetical protein
MNVNEIILLSNQLYICRLRRHFLSLIFNDKQLQKGDSQKSWIFPHTGNSIKWKYLMSIELLRCRFL